MNRDDEIILDLIRAASLILEFTKNMNLNTFLDDIKTQSFVLYQIMIIGEAINRLSPEFAQTHPQIPINSIRGMRNRVIHLGQADQQKRVGGKSPTRSSTSSTRSSTSRAKGREISC